MNMTNSMELLMTNQPWNILVYMVVPVALVDPALMGWNPNAAPGHKM